MSGSGARISGVILHRPRHPTQRRRFKAQVNLSSDEYCLLEDAAREQGLALGSFVRQAALAFTVAERARLDDLAVISRAAR